MHPSAQRVASIADSLRLDISIFEFEESTGTAQEAADAIGCDVAQIVKSLCFVINEKPVMALVSGKNQLDTGKLAGLQGVGKKKVKRANADFVKEVTGFSIGGVPPFGHLTKLKTYIDKDLMEFDEIWAAAGTPHAVFSVNPQAIVLATGGQVIELGKLP